VRQSARSTYAISKSSSSKPSATIEVTRTYLEMRAASDLQATRSNDPLIKIEPQLDCSIELFPLTPKQVRTITGLIAFLDRRTDLRASGQVRELDLVDDL
jgi:hypothetical protein